MIGWSRWRRNAVQIRPSGFVKLTSSASGASRSTSRAMPATSGIVRSACASPPGPAFSPSTCSTPWRRGISKSELPATVAVDLDRHDDRVGAGQRFDAVGRRAHRDAASRSPPRARAASCCMRSSGAGVEVDEPHGRAREHRIGVEVVQRRQPERRRARADEHDGRCFAHHVPAGRRIRCARGEAAVDDELRAGGVRAVVGREIAARASRRRRRVASRPFGTCRAGACHARDRGRAELLAQHVGVDEARDAPSSRARRTARARARRPSSCRAPRTCSRCRRSFPREPCSPATDEMLTIEPDPCPIIVSATAFMPRNVPTWLIVTIRMYSSSVVLVMPTIRNTPALLTSTSMRPNRDRVVVDDRGPVGFARHVVTEVRGARHRAPWRRAHRRRRARRPASRCAPSATNSRASAAPCPRAAPVISATLPSSRPIAGSYDSHAPRARRAPPGGVSTISATSASGRGAENR